MKTFYDVPTQVIFYDVYNEKNHGGIAYQDFIICGCCGGTYPLEDLKEDLKDFNLSLEENFYEQDWISLDEEIIGQ